VCLLKLRANEVVNRYTHKSMFVQLSYLAFLIGHFLVFCFEKHIHKYIVPLLIKLNNLLIILMDLWQLKNQHEVFADFCCHVLSNLCRRADFMWVESDVSSFLLILAAM